MEKCLAPLPMVYDIFRMQFIRFSRVCSNADDFNNRNQILSAKLLKQGYRFHKLPKAYSKVTVPDACLWLGPSWLSLMFSLALTICES